MHRFVSQVCQKKPNLMVLLITGSLGSYHTQVPHEQSTCFYKSTHVCTYHQCMQQGTNLVWHECTRNTEKDNGRRCAGPGNTDVVDNYRLRLMSRVYIYPRDIYNAFFRDNYSIEVYMFRPSHEQRGFHEQSGPFVNGLGTVITGPTN